MIKKNRHVKKHVVYDFACKQYAPVLKNLSDHYFFFQLWNKKQRSVGSENFPYPLALKFL